MNIHKWAKYLNEAKVNELPKAFEFIKKSIDYKEDSSKSVREYDEILELAIQNEVKKKVK